MTRTRRPGLASRTALAVRGIPARQAAASATVRAADRGRGDPASPAGSEALPGASRRPARAVRVAVLGLLRVARWLRLLVRYGRAAPRADERVWIVPRECRRRVSAGQVGDVGVVAGTWTERSHRQPHEASAKMMDLIAHFRDGLPWTRTTQYRRRFGRFEARGEAFPPALAAERRTFLEDCARYDRVFATVRAEGRLRTARELAARGEQARSFSDRLARWREPGGVRISIDAQGLPVWSGDGSHRLAMAIALDLPEMPARLMAVHPAAVPDWRRRFRAGRPARSGVRRGPGPVSAGRSD